MTNEGSAISGKRTASIEPLLTVGQAGDLLNTGPRFIRRLIAERRIRFIRVGRHVRIPESALREYIDAGVVEPVRVRWHGGRVVA